jgi:catalase
MPTLNIDGTLAKRVQPLEDIDFYQTGEFWRRVLSSTDKKHLVSNIAGHLGNAKQNIQYRQTALFYKADKEYGSSVAKALKLDVHKVAKLATMKPIDRVKATS